MARKRKYRADVVDGEEQPVDASPVRKSNIGSRKLIVISFHPLFSSPSLSLPPSFFSRARCTRLEIGNGKHIFTTLIVYYTKHVGIYFYILQIYKFVDTFS